MKLIAVTGGIGSGKSLAGQILKQQGYTVIDTDNISRSVVKCGSKGLKLLVMEFGNQIKHTNGRLNRKALANIVFKDENKLKKLNSIIHPLIEEKLNLEMQLHNHEKFVFVLVPLLFELKWESRFYKVWLILADESIRIQRAAKRDGSDVEDIKNRIKNQINYAEKCKLAHNILYNNSTVEEFKVQVLKSIKTL